MMYLYYRENGEIVAISPVDEEMDDTLVSNVSIDHVIDFINGSKDSNQYIAVFSNGELTFKKKDVVRRDNIPRSHYLYNPLVDECDADLVITTYKTRIRVTINPKHLTREQQSTATVYGYRYIPFHYVVDGDPHFLVKTVTVSFSDLLSGTPVYFDLDVDVSRCEIFVKNPFTVVHRFEDI